MDIAIILSAVFSFMLFLLLHTIIFRKVDKKKVLVWIANTCLIGGIFPIVFSLIFTYKYPVLEYSFILQFVIVFFLSFLLYSLFAIIYILGPFGLIESSLRIRLLEEIAQAHEKGIKKQQLFKVYNRNVIIRKRLDRFILSKDIVYINDHYIFQNRFSYFIVQTFLFEYMKKIYLSDIEKSRK